MAEYNDVPTVVELDPWTITQWNRFIRDNFLASLPRGFTAKGDLMAGSGTANRGGILPVGSNDMVLSANSAEALGMKWQYDGVREIVTAKGDLVAGTGTAALARLGLPNTHTWTETWPEADSGEASGILLNSNPYALATVGVHAFVTKGSVAVVSYTAEVQDTHGIYTPGDGSTAYSHFDIPTGYGGYWLLTVSLTSNEYNNVAVGKYVELSVYINDVKWSTPAVQYYQESDTQWWMGELAGIDLLELDEGDEVYVGYATDTGVTYTPGDGMIALKRVG